MVCSIGRARVGQDDNVKSATENVEQRVALIRDDFLISCANPRDAQLYTSIEAHLSGAQPPTHAWTYTLNALGPLLYSPKMPQDRYQRISHTLDRTIAMNDSL